MYMHTHTIHHYSLKATLIPKNRQFFYYVPLQVLLESSMVCQTHPRGLLRSPLRPPLWKILSAIVFVCKWLIVFFYYLKLQTYLLFDILPVLQFVISQSKESFLKFSLRAHRPFLPAWPLPKVAFHYRGVFWIWLAHLACSSCPARYTTKSLAGLLHDRQG